MRVALITGTFGAGRGSGGQAELLTRGLRARGHAVTVVCRAADRDPGVDPPRLALPVSRRALPAWMHTFDRRGFDVVFAFERVPGADVYRAGGGVHESWMASAPRALTRWGLRAADRRERHLDHAAATLARRVVCNADRTAAEVRAWHGAQAVEVIRNGVDLSRFQPKPRPRRHGKVALFLGEGGGRKGLDVAIAAFRAAAGTTDQLWVAGATPRRPPPGVIAIGHVDPAAVLPEVDAMILPSRYDPSSNAVLEALASGVPPVCSARDGASEIVDDPHLIVARPTDVQGFAAALRYAWDQADPTRWRALAERWPDARMVDATERLLGRLADGQEAD